MPSSQILIIILIIIFIIMIWYIVTFNKLKRSVIKINEAISGIDVALVKRHDILIKMIEVVKAYAEHERKVIFEVTQLRTNMSIKEKTAANKNMDENFEKVNLIAENYPDLKASENYKKLQQSIIDVEDHLQAARRLYNSNVSSYNQLIASFPTIIVAKIHNMVEKDFFEASDEEKELVKVKL